MAFDTIGLSFAPTAQNQAGAPSRSGDPSLTPVQQAIKILSLHVPQNAGPGGIAPTALLTSPGAAGLGLGLGGGGDLVSFLRRLLQPGAMGGVGAMGSGAGAPTAAPMTMPTPHVIPGTPPGLTLPGPGAPASPDASASPWMDRTNLAPGNRPTTAPLMGIPSEHPMPFRGL